MEISVNGKILIPLTETKKLQKKTETKWKNLKRKQINLDMSVFVVVSVVFPFHVM